MVFSFWVPKVVPFLRTRVATRRSQYCISNIQKLGTILGPRIGDTFWFQLWVPNLQSLMFFCFVCWLVAAVLGPRHVNWLHGLVECTGRGSTHLRGAALARILALEADMKTRSGVARARAQSRQVFDQVSVCSVARARGPRALAERLLRNDDRRATKQIELIRRALTMLAATVCTKSIASHCRVERRTRR